MTQANSQSSLLTSLTVPQPSASTKLPIHHRPMTRLNLHSSLLITPQHSLNRNIESSSNSTSLSVALVAGTVSSSLFLVIISISIMIVFTLVVCSIKVRKSKAATASERITQDGENEINLQHPVIYSDENAYSYPEVVSNNPNTVVAKQNEAYVKSVITEDNDVYEYISATEESNDYATAFFMKENDVYNSTGENGDYANVILPEMDKVAATLSDHQSGGVEAEDEDNIYESCQ